MPTPFASPAQLAAQLTAESAKLEQALDDQISRLGALKPARVAQPLEKVRLRKATILLLSIAVVLACLTAFSFGFLAGFH